MHRFLGVVLVAGGTALCASLLAAPSPVHAATFTVDSIEDEPDANPGDGTCQSTITSRCTLRAAVMEANARPGADSITLPAGRFKLKLAGGDDVAAVGDLDLLDSVTITGPGPAQAVIDASGLTTRDRVFDVRPGTEVTLNGLRVTGGLPRNLNGGGDGGGIRVTQAAGLELSGVSVDGNEALSSGGGIALRGAIYARIRNSTVDRNRAWSDGGGISVIDAMLYLENSTVSRNSSGRYGGGLALFTNDVSVKNSTVSSNNATDRGGGLYLASRGNRGFNAVFQALYLTLAYNGASGSNGSGANLFIDSPAGVPRWIMRSSLITVGSRGGNCGGQLVDSQGFNLDDRNTCGFTAAGDLVNTNPMVGALRLDSSTTEVHPLPRNSPAVDAIPDCQNGSDQRGVTRPKDGNGDGSARCDIGAYELVNR